MKILVTGATGRIGSRLVAELLRRDHQVRALVMPGDPLRARVEVPGVEIVEGQLTERDSLRPAVEGVDAVYHLGAHLPQGRTSDELFDTNVVGTYNLLETLVPHASRIKRFVLASTDNVYWNPNGALYLPVDEEHPRINDDPYGMSKILCEDMCWVYMRRCGLPVTIPRFGVTLACEELLDPASIWADKLYLPGFLKLLKAKPNLSREEQETVENLEDLDARDPMLVIARDPQGVAGTEMVNDPRNLAEGLVLLLENEIAVGKVFHLMAAQPFAHDELLKYISKVTGWPYVEVTVSKVVHWELSIAKARAMLGYNPTRDVFQMIDEGWALMKS